MVLIENIGIIGLLNYLLLNFRRSCIMIFTLLLAAPAFIIIWFVVTYIEHVWQLRKYPKGPFPLPMIGNLKMLSKEPYIDLINLSKIYGDVFSMSFGMLSFL